MTRRPWMRALALLTSVSIAMWASVPAAAQERERVEDEEAAVTDAPQTPRHGFLGPALMMGAGGLVVIGGLTLFALGGEDRRAVENAPDGSRWDDYATQAERGPILLGVGQIMMAAGLIVLGAGLTWLILALADADPDPFGTAGLELELGPMGARLGGRF